MALPADAVALCRERFGIEAFPDEGPTVPADQVLALARALKIELGYTYFVYCAAAHYAASGAAAGDLPDRVLVEYRVRRLPGADFPFRVVVPTGSSTPSLAGIWRGADWQEREQLDLVGVVFAGHPDPRRLMLPEDWEGHPLRRDYAIDTRHHPWR